MAILKSPTLEQILVAADGKYLPLTGGTLRGNLTLPNGVAVGGSNLTADQLVVGGGDSKIKTLASGADGQVLKMVNGVPTWATDGELDTSNFLLLDGSRAMTGLLKAPKGIEIGDFFTLNSYSLADSIISYKSLYIQPSGDLRLEPQSSTYNGIGGSIELDAHGYIYLRAPKGLILSGDYGTDGQVLTSQGEGKPPVWRSVSSSGGDYLPLDGSKAMTGTLEVKPYDSSTDSGGIKLSSVARLIAAGSEIVLDRTSSNYISRLYMTTLGNVQLYTAPTSDSSIISGITLSPGGIKLSLPSGSGATNQVLIQDEYGYIKWGDIPSPNNVTQTVRTTDGNFPILLRGDSAGTATTTTTTSFASGVTINPSSGLITSKGIILDGAGVAQTAGTGYAIQLKKNGTDTAHIRLTNSNGNNNLLMESKGNIILYGGTDTDGTAFQSSTYVGISQANIFANGTIDIGKSSTNKFRNLYLSGSAYIAGDALYNSSSNKINLPSAAGTLIIDSNIATSSSAGLVKSKTTGTMAGRDYYVEVASDGTMKVNVPWERGEAGKSLEYSLALGSSTSTTNSTTAVTSPYLNLIETSAVNSSIRFVGSQNVSVSGNNGTITITGPSLSSYVTTTTADGKYLPLDGSKAMTGTLTLAESSTSEVDSVDGGLAIGPAVLGLAEGTLFLAYRNPATLSKCSSLMLSTSGFSLTDMVNNVSIDEGADKLWLYHPKLIELSSKSISIKINNSTGNLNQVLASDGAGGLKWYDSGSGLDTSNLLPIDGSRAMTGTLKAASLTDSSAGGIYFDGAGGLFGNRSAIGLFSEQFYTFLNTDYAGMFGSALILDDVNVQLALDGYSGYSGTTLKSRGRSVYWSLGGALTNLGKYGFFPQGTGETYESNNGKNQQGGIGIQTSAAVCKLSFFVTKNPGKLVISYMSYGESNYDYGLFSNLDTELSLDYDPNEYTSANVYKSCRGESASTSKTLTYDDIAPGPHFIYIKYVKDASTDSNNDSLQFRISSDTTNISFEPCESSSYILPIATYNTLGGVKLPSHTGSIAYGSALSTSNTAITVNERTAISGRYYEVEAGGNGRLFVNVPWSSGNNTPTYSSQGQVRLSSSNGYGGANQTSATTTTYTAFKYQFYGDTAASSSNTLDNYTGTGRYLVYLSSNNSSTGNSFGFPPSAYSGRYSLDVMTYVPTNTTGGYIHQVLTYVSGDSHIWDRYGLYTNSTTVSWSDWKLNVKTLSLNGKLVDASSFYAPTKAGTAGQILYSTGEGSAPDWGDAPPSIDTSGFATLSGANIFTNNNKFRRAGVAVTISRSTTNGWTMECDSSGNLVFTRITTGG